jgi:methionyl-tRNA synthetase
VSGIYKKWKKKMNIKFDEFIRFDEFTKRENTEEAIEILQQGLIDSKIKFKKNK